MSIQIPVAWCREPDKYGRRRLSFEKPTRTTASTWHPLYLSPGAQPAPSIPEGWKEGIEAVASMLQKKADDYAEEYGYDDMGVLSFGEGMCGQIKMDYYTNLIELTEEVRAMLTATTEAKS